jgi:hypothetical protein
MPLRAKQRQEPSYRLRTANGDDGDAVGGEIAATALCERLECHAVADPLDEHDRADVDARARRLCFGDESSNVIAGRRLGPMKPLLLVHVPHLHR